MLTTKIEIADIHSSIQWCSQQIWHFHSSCTTTTKTTKTITWLSKQKIWNKLFISLDLIACIDAAKWIHCEMGMMEGDGDEISKLFAYQ